MVLRIAQLKTVRLIQICSDIILHTQEQQNDAHTYPLGVKLWSVTVAIYFISRVDACSAIKIILLILRHMQYGAGVSQEAAEMNLSVSMHASIPSIS